MIGVLRPLEWGLLGLAALLGVLMAVILSSIGDEPHWLPEPGTRAHPSPRVQVAPNVPLEDFSATWQTPLFSPDRSPDREAGPTRVSNLANFTLSGIMITGNLQMAWLKQANGPALTVRLGQRLPNGWRLEHLTPQYARFALDGRTQTLSLYAKRLPPPSTRPPVTLPREPLP
ncbi:general secretion pathway protein GspN [Pseudomonas tolaasii]|uniref:General secretion pathway protein GspN n=2 Tax=Pseudomonas tolaasii TaxID=29442 RepID=A0A7Y8AKY0_PSETO|nr:general secretion pathway protein GspN [Pseudomonas tolaasii]ARB29584.1 general secretion pathway protein GspN [Pseudomonas tolaasii]KAB0478231.1 general secretion pathway protein GspN [Pseudomonas tolaasii]MBW4793350.1 general secretion pathway protein GspN [Pseudomonas tolaasii]MBY8942902.1 general secretion pathway protein GspN [Pseudomonas tolaasii]NWC23596.1 general secretion pathway protein GspN [Pseudomonas tolaasii]